MKRLSGDQKGYAAPSVPATGCAANESIGRIQSCTFPAESRTVSASLLPSGEMAADAPTRFAVAAVNTPLSGGRTKNRVTGRGTDRTLYHALAPAIVVNSSSHAAICQMRAERCARLPAGAGRAAVAVSAGG